MDVVEEHTASSGGTWDTLCDLPEGVLRGVYAHGFEQPSPIQSEAIPHMVRGVDVIGQAQSGTGKTGAFSVGLLARLAENPCRRALVIAPTRELAVQSASVISSIGKYVCPDVHVLVGGTPVQQDISALRKDPQVVVGTPGRVYDMINRGVMVRGIDVVVIDEADELLSAGFADQLYDIFQGVPKCAQVALFSATMSDEVLQIAHQFMNDPTQISVKADQLTLEGISQYYVAVEGAHKLDVLKDLYATLSLSQCIIYCNSVARVERLYEEMRDDDFPVCRIHGNMDRDERETSYAAFREGRNRVLISSNLTARGIDVQQVSTVINFDFPTDTATYLHRIGRSGRWGRKGSAINFITSRDTSLMREVEKFYSTTVSELPASFVA